MKENKNLSNEVRKIKEVSNKTVANKIVGPSKTLHNKAISTKAIFPVKNQKAATKPIENWKSGKNVITKPVDVNQKVAKIEKLVNHTYKQKQIKNKRILFSVLGIGAILLGIGVTIPSIMFTNKESVIVTDKKIAIEWEDEKLASDEILEILNGKEFANVSKIEEELNLVENKGKILQHTKNNEVLELKQIKVIALEIIDENEVREYDIDFEFGLKAGLDNDYEILADKIENLVVNPNLKLVPIDASVSDLEILKNNINNLMVIIDEEEYENLEIVNSKIAEVFQANKDELIKHFNNHETIDKIKVTNLKKNTNLNLLHWDFDLKLIPKGGYDFNQKDKTIELANILIKKGINITYLGGFDEKINELIGAINLNDYNDIPLIEFQINNLIEQNFELLTGYFDNSEYIEKFMIENLNNSENQNWNFELNVELNDGYVLNNQVQTFKIENVVIEKLVELNFDKIGFTNKLNELDYAVNLNDYANNSLIEFQINSLLEENIDLLKQFFDNNEYIEELGFKNLVYLNNERWSFDLSLQLQDGYVVAEKDENIKIDNFLIKKRGEIIKTSDIETSNFINRVLNTSSLDYDDYFNSTFAKEKLQEKLNQETVDLKKDFENGEYIDSFEITNFKYINDNEMEIDVKPLINENFVLINENFNFKMSNIKIQKHVGVKFEKEKFNDLIQAIDFSKFTSNTVSSLENVVRDIVKPNSLMVIKLKNNEIIVNFGSIDFTYFRFYVSVRTKNIVENDNSHIADYYVNVTWQQIQTEVEYNFKNDEWEFFIGRIETKTVNGQMTRTWKEVGDYSEYDLLL